MSYDERQLKAEILLLTKQLEEKREILFFNRLANMTPLIDNVSDITINIEDSEDWCISYVHTTDNYDINNYLPDLDDIPTGMKYTSEISFGKYNRKYFIKGGIKFNIYRNSVGELRVINPEYDFDLDMDEQRALIYSYSKNVNIPEACALAVFLYMNENKWDDAALINYLSVV